VQRSSLIAVKTVKIVHMQRLSLIASVKTVSMEAKDIVEIKVA